MSTVLIRQIPDDYAEETGLAKYNRSRMPGCKDTFVAGENFDGTHTTGLSEEKVSNYSRILNKDFSATSPFWQNFSIVIYADKPKVFDTAKPLDDISLTVLIANGIVAPDKEAAYTPNYKDAQYYAYTEESENQEEISSRKKRDIAIGNLMSISEDKDRMILYGGYLEGIKYNEKLKVDTLYKMLRAYIEDKDIKNAQNFIDVFAKDVEEIQQKILVDKALKQRLIIQVSVGNKKRAYQYGQVTVGSTIDEVYRNMALPDFAPELMAIKAELDKQHN